MKSYLGNDGKGQLSLYDAILFFIIICIASAIIITSVRSPSDVDDIKDDNTLTRYTEEAYAAIVKCTCYKVSYDQYDLDEDHPGEVEKSLVTLENKSVPYLLLFDVDARERVRMLNEAGDFDESTGEDAIYALEEGIEKPVNELVNRMVGYEYFYILKVIYNGSEVFDLRDGRLSKSFQPSEFTTSEGNFGGFIDPYGNAIIRLSIWRS